MPFCWRSARARLLATNSMEYRTHTFIAIPTAPRALSIVWTRRGQPAPRKGERPPTIPTAIAAPVPGLGRVKEVLP